MQQIDRTTLLNVSSRKDSCGRLGSLNRLGWLRCLPQVRSDLRSNKCLPQLSYNVLLETLGESNTIPIHLFQGHHQFRKTKPGASFVAKLRRPLGSSSVFQAWLQIGKLGHPLSPMLQTGPRVKRLWSYLQHSLEQFPIHSPEEQYPSCRYKVLLLQLCWSPEVARLPAQTLNP